MQGPLRATAYPGQQLPEDAALEQQEEQHQRGDGPQRCIQKLQQPLFALRSELRGISLAAAASICSGDSRSSTAVQGRHIAFPVNIPHPWPCARKVFGPQLQLGANARLLLDLCCLLLHRLPRLGRLAPQVILAVEPLCSGGRALLQLFRSGLETLGHALLLCPPAHAVAEIAGAVAGPCARWSCQNRSPRPLHQLQSESEWWRR